MLSLLWVHQSSWTYPSDHVIQTHTSHSNNNDTWKNHYIRTIVSAISHGLISALVHMPYEHTIENWLWAHQSLYNSQSQPPMQCSISSVMDTKHRQLIVLHLLDIYMLLFNPTFLVGNAKAMMKIGSWCYRTNPILGCIFFYCHFIWDNLSKL